MLKPTQPVPPLSVPLVGGGHFDIAASRPNPKSGTPLMQSQQTAGLDLPLRVLIWQDAGGTTQVGHAPPALIATRHGITDRGDVIDKMKGALAAITAAATAP